MRCRTSSQWRRVVDHSNARDQIVQQLSEKVFKLVVRMPNFTHWLYFARRSKCDKVPNDLMKFFSHLSRAGKAYF